MRPPSLGKRRGTCKLTAVTVGRFEIASLLSASPATVWARVSTMDGVNAELMPLARMTHPPEMQQLDPARIPYGQRLFRSWVFLFGMLPVDWDDLTLIWVEAERGFLEHSTMLSQRRWVHERILEPVDGGCRVTDRIEFEPRLPVLAPVYAAVFRFFFRHRHRRLRRAFARE